MKSYKIYLSVLFLNAFIDLGHKITVQNVIFRAYEPNTQIVLSAILGAFLILPFVTFFSLSGYLADRYSKAAIMQYLAISAVAISALSILVYISGSFWGIYFLTLLYAIQAALFSPAKFGYIKDMTSDENILKINAGVQALTMGAMISAGVIFSLIFEFLIPKELISAEEITKLLWPIGLTIMALTSIQAFLSLRLANSPQNVNEPAFSPVKALKLGYLKQNLSYITPNLWRIVLVLSSFWALAQIISAVFPAYAKEFVGITNTVIVQEKLAMIIVGMVAGSIFCAKADRGFIDLGLAIFGAIGMSVCVLAITLVHSGIGLSLSFLTFGFFGACFAIPLNSYIQHKTDKNKIGIVIAGLNFVQSLSMLGALMITSQMALIGLNGAEIFWTCAFLVFVVSFFISKEPFKDFLRFIIISTFALRYKIEKVGEVPNGSHGVLALGNHVSWIDWAMLNCVYPQKIYFVMEDELYQKKRRLLEFFDVIPIAPKPSKSFILRIRKLLCEGKTVCIFPEGEITKTGELGKFKRGFRLILKDEELQNVQILPFYIDGLFGSKFAYAKGVTHFKRREVTVYFGKTLVASASVDKVEKAVKELFLKRAIA